MSALGRGAIIKRMQTGELSVSPLLSKDAKLVQRALICAWGTSPLSCGPADLSCRSHGCAEQENDGPCQRNEVQQKHERHELPFRARLLLHPGALVLVPTLEWVSLPDNIMGAVTARSTWRVKA